MVYCAHTPPLVITLCSSFLGWCVVCSENLFMGHDLHWIFLWCTCDISSFWALILSPNINYEICAGHSYYLSLVSLGLRFFLDSIVEINLVYLSKYKYHHKSFCAWLVCIDGIMTRTRNLMVVTIITFHLSYGLLSWRLEVLYIKWDMYIYFITSLW